MIRKASTETLLKLAVYIDELEKGVKKRFAHRGLHHLDEGMPKERISSMASNVGNWLNDTTKALVDRGVIKPGEEELKFRRVAIGSMNHHLLTSTNFTFDPRSIIAKSLIETSADDAQISKRLDTLDKDKVLKNKLISVSKKNPMIRVMKGASPLGGVMGRAELALVASHEASEAEQMNNSLLHDKMYSGNLYNRRSAAWNKESKRSSHVGEQVLEDMIATRALKPRNSSEIADIDDAKYKFQTMRKDEIREMSDALNRRNELITGKKNNSRLSELLLDKTTSVNPDKYVKISKTLEDNREYNKVLESKMKNTNNPKVIKYLQSKLKTTDANEVEKQLFPRMNRNLKREIYDKLDESVAREQNNLDAFRKARTVRTKEDRKKSEKFKRFIAWSDKNPNYTMKDYQNFSSKLDYEMAPKPKQKQVVKPPKYDKIETIKHPKYEQGHKKTTVQSTATKRKELVREGETLQDAKRRIDAEKARIKTPVESKPILEAPKSESKIKSKTNKAPNTENTNKNKIQVSPDSSLRGNMVEKSTDKPIIGSKVETKPIIEAPKVETKPIIEAPKVETKPIIEAPKVETKPVIEAPKVETKPIIEAPKVETKPIIGSEIVEAPKYVGGGGGGGGGGTPTHIPKYAPKKKFFGNKPLIAAALAGALGGGAYLYHRKKDRK